MKKILFVFLMISVVVMAENDKLCDDEVIGRSVVTVNKGGLMTPEILWAMGRIGNASISANGRGLVYNVTYYSVEKNKSHSILHITDLETCETKSLTSTSRSERDAVFINNDQQLLFAADGKLWVSDVDGSNCRQVKTTKEGKRL